ncbi:disabled homolog 2-interacting protein-like isoform X9 [Ostrea edulis]|uniref:disabled homolog 2-interacting protein-like isoform X9 n=1 Tax=Ostrea edulis TaxID=37623 RepID=UPI0024AF8D06|nr:disabled homolog 2-interacting protein-like isoform X9 [Ostrea edulis]
MSEELGKPDSDQGPRSRIEGWLMVWDASDELTAKLWSYGPSIPAIPWEPSFCVLREDLKTLTFHNQEEGADDQPSLVVLRRKRLDDGKQEFDKRWGFETLRSIRENAKQHQEEHLLCPPQPCMSCPLDKFSRSPMLDTFNDSMPDSSYEKLSDRRGSEPLVSSSLDLRGDVMDTSSTPSKIANFFMKKGFKSSNLKRTKSVTKLDNRKRSASHVMDSHESNTFVSSLKRTMSLGRLNRKRNRDVNVDSQSDLSEQKNSLNIINSRIRSSRSHESLLTSSVTMHSIDLTGQDIDVKPLHNSVLGKEHCLQVATSHGSKYISCRTSEERQKWLGSLRKTVQPNQDNMRRTDNSLKLWIKEAKNVPCKKRYYCEICMDQTLYARTSSKTKSDMLFWGEHFEFNNLNPVQIVTVNLYREADIKKKKKDKNTKIGYINIPVAEIHGRQFVEKWFTASSGTVGKTGKENKGDLPLVRLRLRYQTVHILPKDLYQDFTQYLTTDFYVLCEVMENLVGVRDKEDIASTLVHIMQKLDKAKEFLTEVIIGEVIKQDNQHLTFRGNSIGTKAMEAYMKLVGEKYLKDTLSDFVHTIINTEDDCEVDPGKLANPTSITTHQQLLDMYCNMVWTKIISSPCYFPSELRDVFASFRTRCHSNGKTESADTLICGSIFLRFLCPAILSPSLFNLTQEFPPEKAARNLTLIAKTIQTLANSTKFGGKEEYMEFMNDFIEKHDGSMKEFLDQISSANNGNHLLDYDGYIDLGKELALLHILLTENLEKANQDTLMKLGKLTNILGSITSAIDDPEVGKSVQVPDKRKSQIYDNVSSSIQLGSSPTEIVRNMLRQYGEEDNIPVLGARHSRQGSHISSGHSTVSDYNDNDDEYVIIKRVHTHSDNVSNVSANSKTITSEHSVNQKWNDIVNAAEGNHGDYIDLLSLMDDEYQNSSMELEHNINGSQMSISQLSTVTSGYQSYGYSQSNSPVDSSNHVEGNTRPSQSNSLQPLSFSNPMYRYKHMNSSSCSSSSQCVTPSPGTQGSASSGSLSSEEDTNVTRNRNPNPSRPDFCDNPSDPLRNLAPKLSSSSSSESLNDFERHRMYSDNRDSSHKKMEPVTFDLHSSCPTNVFEDNFNSKYENTHGYSLSRAPTRPSELSHTGSMDFSQLRQYNRYGEGLRRTATDSVIAKSCSPSHSDSGVRDRGRDSSEESPSHRRLSPQNAVHMGIRSVQRKIHEQEKTKQEYEQEVTVLKQQLFEAQQRLQFAEEKLNKHECDSQKVMEDWQYRLEESEERMRRQQAEKDDQMKHIITRLMNVEGELRHDQEEMQTIVKQKQKVIEAQERRIKTLDNANAKLMSALHQLRSVSQTNNNTMLGPLRTNLISPEVAEFKTSSC